MAGAVAAEAFDRDVSAAFTRARFTDANPAGTGSRTPESVARRESP
jgi:hypothetical protein